MAIEGGRVRKDRLLVLLTMLITSAVCVYLYLSWTAYTSLGTRLITSTVISILFTSGYAISGTWRCASLVFGMQLVSPLGVLITFDTLSWFLLILPDIETISEAQERITAPGPICSFVKNDTLSNTQILLGSLHYVPVVTYGLIFLYCVCCVVFFEETVNNNPTLQFTMNYPATITAPPEESQKQRKTKFLRLLAGIGELLNHGQFGIFILAVTLTQWRNQTVETLNKLMQECEENGLFSPLNGTLFTFYLLGSAICVLVLVFSPKFHHRRDRLIRKFKLKVKDGQERSAYFLRRRAIAQNTAAAGATVQFQVDDSYAAQANMTAQAGASSNFNDESSY